ncbi:hypothetical protein [Nitratireductor luteus]|uniref:hypothetical protein n=1 Tax=Nitratireductor luteus TaxID=2976980 RepID=UPI002240763F|nr:hypothetical protein [Nitratireductor luteus]
MTENIFSLRYEGTGISEGLEPSAFAETVRGFAEFVTTVSESVYGEGDDTKLKVHRLTQGSLLLELWQSVSDMTVNDLLAIGASVATEMQMAIDLLKHLRGQPPKVVSNVSDGGVSVENNSGNIAVFNQSTVNLVINGDIGSSVERFTKPVSDGLSSGFALEMNTGPVASVSSQDAPSMVSVAQDKELLESESEIWLTATKVVLQGEAKWTFSDGRRPFAAPVVDPEFLASVSSGRERFGSGDRLLVRLKAKQSQRGTRLRTQYEVIKVLKHEPKPARIQDSLF